MLRSFKECFGGNDNNDGDDLLWHAELKDTISLAVVQANSSLEDQCTVFTCPHQDAPTFVGVFDGHGGPHASRFVNHILFHFLHKFEKEQNGLSTYVFVKAFAATEEEFLSVVARKLPSRLEFGFVGSCCLVGAISHDDLYVANLGNSRAVLCKKVFDGVKDCVVAERLSSDHNVACEC